MINAGVSVFTNSANATLIACTTAGHFLGAVIGGGDGTLTILDGSSPLAVIKNTANLDTISLMPSLPIRFANGLSASLSGTGAVTLFFVNAV